MKLLVSNNNISNINYNDKNLHMNDNKNNKNIKLINDTISMNVKISFFLLLNELLHL